MIDLTIKPQFLDIDGKVESTYVYFRGDVSIKEALPFVLGVPGDLSLRVIVYVGVDGLPAAIQMPDPLTMPVGACALPRNITIEQAKMALFGIACKMIAFVEAGRQRLGAALVEDAVHTIRSLSSEESDEDCCLTH